VLTHGLGQSEKRNNAMNKHVTNRFASTVGKWFLCVSSKTGFQGLPLQVYFLLVLGFVFSLGRNIAFPYLAMFLNGKVENGGLGFDSSLVGSMLMIGGLSYTFTLLAAGSLCDRFGRKTMMVASLIPQCLMVAAFAFARSYPEFLLLYALTGIVGAFYDPAYNAMIADLVQPERREEVYGLGYMTGNIGTMVGPLIGGILASEDGYSVLFLYAAIFAAAATAGLVLLTRESKPKDIISTISFSQFAGIFRDRLFVFFCFMGALTNLVYTQLYGLLSVYIQYVGFEPYIFGILFSLNGAMVVTLQIPIRMGATRIGPAKAFIVAQLLYAAGFSYFMVARSLEQFIAGAVVLTLGEIIFVPASSGFVANLAPADKRGRYMAMFGLFFGIGGSAGAQLAFSIFGALANKELTWGIFGLIGFTTLIGYALLFKMAKNVKKERFTGNQ
jgi:MFS family permease